MSDYLAAAAAGLGAGAVFALLGLGLVTTARGSGVVNFGFGAMTGWSAYVFFALRSDAEYPIVVPGPLESISFGEDVRMTFASAVLLTLLTSVAIGVVSYLVVFRALRSAPVVAKVVASVGVLLVLQAMIGVRFDGDSVNLTKVLPSGVVEVTDEILVAVDALWLTAIAVLLAVVLWVLSRRTRTGLAIRAASESEKGAVLLGFEPDRLGLVTWVIASLIAGLIGILATPLFELTPLLYTQLLVPALGAALIGRFVSFGWTVVAGLAIGMVQAMAAPLQQDLEWLPRTGVRDGFVFVAIVVAMVVLGKRLPTRGSIDHGRLPPVADGAVRPPVAAAGVLLVALGFVLLPDSWGLALLTSVLFTGLALSLVVLTGFMGQISLAQMAFAGVAGFTLSRLAERFGVPFPIAPLLAAAVAAVFGVVVGVPALRVRGVNLAIVTLAGGIAIQEFVFKNPSFVGDVSTGGAKVPTPTLFSWNLGLRSADDPYRPVFGVMVTVAVALLAVAVANLRRSGSGRRMLAVRSNERASASIGIGIASTKLLAFGVSSFIAGLAGTLVAYRFGSVSDTSYGFFASLTLLAFAYLGGITSVTGAIVAGLLVADGIGFELMDAAWERLGIDVGRWELLVGAVGLVVMAVQNPDGIAGLGRRVRARHRAAGAPDPSATEAAVVTS